MVSVWHQSTARTIRKHRNHLLSYRSRGILMSNTDHSAQRRLKSNAANVLTVWPRPRVNVAAILVRATLRKSYIGTEENIPDSARVWGSTDRRTFIKTDLGVLSFTCKNEQLFLDVFWSYSNFSALSVSQSLPGSEMNFSIVGQYLPPE